MVLRAPRKLKLQFSTRIPLKSPKSDKIINKFAFPASAELSKPLELLRIMYVLEQDIVKVTEITKRQIICRNLWKSWNSVIWLKIC